MQKTGEFKIYKTKSGLKYSMDKKRHDELESNLKFLIHCEGYIVTREYFIQLCIVVATFIFLFLWYTKFYQIFCCNIIIGIISMLLYKMLPLYKIMIIPMISSFFGVFVFRFFIHFIIIGILSFTIFDNGWIFIYCIISGVFTNIIISLLDGYKQTLKQNNEIADYVLDEKNKY